MLESPVLSCVSVGDPGDTVMPHCASTVAADAGRGTITTAAIAPALDVTAVFVARFMLCPPEGLMPAQRRGSTCRRGSALLRGSTTPLSILDQFVYVRGQV